MEITITLTEKEIMSTPNDSELGRMVRNKFWQERRNLEGPPNDDEHVILNINPDGTVRSIGGEKDICIICGKETPYLKTTHIDLRHGYVEGAGQACYQPDICKQ
jgi:hypothetical protein